MGRTFIFIIFLIKIVIVQTDNFSVGFIVTLSGVDKHIAGAIPYALHEINQRNDLLNGHLLNFVTVETYRHDSSIGEMKAMMKMEENGVIAFIGPDGRCKSESLIAAAWNIPILSYRCPDFLSSSFQSQSTLIRTEPQVSKYIAAVINHFKWKLITLIVSKEIYWMSVAEAIQKINVENDQPFDVISTYFYPYPYYLRDPHFITTIKKSSKRPQVYIILGNNDVLIDFVTSMQKDKRLESTDPVILSVDDEYYDPGEVNQYLLKGFEHPKNIDNIRQKAFQSVMKLVPDTPTNPDFSSFTSNVSLYTSQEPFNVPTHPLVNVYVPIFAAYAYDAIMIYAHALNETLANDEDPRNGSAIMEKIWSTTFPSVLGNNIHIDSTGQIENDYILLGFKSTKKRITDAKMEPIAKFINKKTNTSKLPVLVFDFHTKWAFERFSRNVSSHAACISYN